MDAHVTAYYAYLVGDDFKLVLEPEVVDEDLPF